MSEELQEIVDLASQMKELGTSYDVEGLREVTLTYCERLQCCSEPLPEAAYLPALQGLRRARAFKELAIAADILYRLGISSGEVRTLHAHAMIELGQVYYAIGYLEQLAAATESDKHDPVFLEAVGLLGRAYKQLFLDEKREPRSHYAGWALQHAITSYNRGYDPSDPVRTSWHAVNVAALIALAKREGVPCPAGLEDERPYARTLVDKLPAAVKPSGDVHELDVWIPGTIAGAHAALGNWDEAAKWYGRYLKQPGLDAHKLFGSIRQLEDVWGLKPELQNGRLDAKGQLVTSLKAALAKLTGGQVVFSARDVRDLIRARGTEGMHTESVLGEDGPVRIAWLRYGLECSQSVARILRRRQKKSHGTGFLVRGADFSAHLGDELFLLTNAHVISDPAELNALTAAEAIATFDGDDSRKDFELAEIVWQSPIRDLDAALLRIRPQPVGFKPLELAPDELIPEAYRGEADKRDAYVIGHPGSEDLSISLHDTDLIDIGYKHNTRKEFIYIRYRTPTKPGNSGSPVFEHDNWRVIGLHHMGAPEQGGLRKLAGKEGFSPAANEGIAIRSIRAAIAAHFGVPPRG